MTRAAVLALAVVACAQQPAPAPAASADGERPYLDRALEVARWLHGCRRPTEHGVSWPIDPARPDAVATNLYSGTAGVVLFLLEAHHATGDAALLAEATAGGDELVASLPADGEPAVCGLYDGVAGLGFTLWKVYVASGEPRFAAAARRCVVLLRAQARAAGAGVEWNDLTDVIGGSAGIGLFLLWAAREMDGIADLDALGLARDAGRHLVELGQDAPGGRRWMMSAGIAREYPNFSHGTAGVCTFLAALYRAIGERAFLDAARAGADYLSAMARDGLVLHHRPGGEDLFYLGWCHGPPGTTRLWELLGEVTGERVWRARIDEAFAALMRSGIPRERTPGLWNNVGQCCGTAGVAEWMLRLPALAGRDAMLEALVEDLERRATRDEKGVRWVHAEHRVRPEEVGAQTGYMQGAAGIGVCLLHLDGVGRREPFVVLPDGGE